MEQKGGIESLLSLPTESGILLRALCLGIARVSLQVSTTQDSHLAEKHLSQRVSTLQEDAADLLKSSRRPLQPKTGDMSLAED
jgi:hypothetical protein